MRDWSAGCRIGIALLWLVLLVVMAWWLSDRLQLTGDLRKFMPEAHTPAQKLLLEELGEGPGSRLLLMSLRGSDPATLARQSQALHQILAGQDQVFELVANGTHVGLEAIPARLLPYRYLLTDSFDAAPLDAAQLKQALQLRLQDLGSPAAILVEPLLPRDPTLEVVHLAERLQPLVAPQCTMVSGLIMLDSVRYCWHRRVRLVLIRRVSSAPTIRYRPRSPGWLSILQLS